MRRSRKGQAQLRSAASGGERCVVTSVYCLPICSISSTRLDSTRLR